MATHGGNVTQDRGCATDLPELPEPIRQCDDDKEQHADQRDHEQHGRAHRQAC
jgi:hypothetical protein